jgi:hypothetical protein
MESKTPESFHSKLICRTTDCSLGVTGNDKKKEGMKVELHYRQ